MRTTGRFGTGSPFGGRPVGEWLEGSFLLRLARALTQRYGLPADEAEDLLQDIRLALWQAGVDRMVNSTWVYSMAVHKAIDQLRSRATQTSLPLTRFSSAGPEIELVHLLRARLASMPWRLRLFCSLRFDEGLNCCEISDRLGLGRPSVRWMEARSLQALGGDAGQTPRGKRKL